MRFGLIALVVASLAFAGSACTPEIGPGTYHCGPERLCPPELACDDTSYTCVTPQSVVPFSCPAGFEDFEPDDDMQSARDLGELECGLPPIQNGNSCLVEGNPADYYMFTYNDDCQGENPHLEISLRYPLALVPLQIELLDGAGTVIAAGEICTSPIDVTGRERICIDAPPVPGTTYFVKVSRAADAPDCDGTCDYNQYILDVNFPLAGN